MEEMQEFSRFLIAQNTCRLLLRTTTIMLHGPEISNFTKFLYAVLYAERIAEILSSLRR